MNWQDMSELNRVPLGELMNIVQALAKFLLTGAAVLLVTTFAITAQLCFSEILRTPHGKRVAQAGEQTRQEYQATTEYGSREIAAHSLRDFTACNCVARRDSHRPSGYGRVM